MHLAHRTRPGTTTGYRNPRPLKIEYSVLGHSISSDNHIRKEITRGPDSAATETSSESDVMLEVKGEKEK